MILVIRLKSRLSSSWLPFWTLYPRFSWAWRQHCWWTLHRSVGLRCSCEGSVRCLRQPPTSLWRWCERWCWGGGLSQTLPTETPGKVVTRVNDITIDVANLRFKFTWTFSGGIYAEGLMLNFGTISPKYFQSK